MSDLFLSILNISFTASWLIIAVIVIRPLMKKAPKWINCALWALVAIRLVCPFSFESSTSVIPNSEPISHNIAMERTPAIDSGVTVIDDVINPVIAEAFTPDPIASANPLQIVIPVLAIVWIVGIVVLILYAMFSYIKLKKSVGATLPLKENVLACDEVKSPFILGVVRPIIYVPSSMSGDSLDYVVMHEKTHIKRGDHLWKPLSYALLAVYWINPLCWLAYILLCRDIELACDEKVIRDMDNDGKAAYSQALLNCSFPRRRIAACPLAFGEVGVKERVKSVLNYKKPAFWIICVSLVACIVLAVCFLTNPKGKAADKLLAKASPETSAMRLSYFDGTNTEVKWLYDETLEKKIINEINDLTVSKCDSGKIVEMTGSCYGLEIADKDGYMIWLTYGNGLWLLKDGSVYEADYNFEELYKTAVGRTERMSGGSGMTNAGLLGEYDTRYYSKAADMSSENEGVSVSITRIEGVNVTLLIANNSGQDFIYGKAYSLQKEIDGVWYKLPVKKSNYGFTNIAYIMPSGESKEEDCGLEMYEELSDGHYRIEKEGMAAEFFVENKQAYFTMKNADTDTAGDDFSEQKNDLSEKILKAISHNLMQYDYDFAILTEKRENEYRVDINAVFKATSIADFDYYKGARAAYENVKEKESGVDYEVCFDETVEFLKDNIGKTEEIRYDVKMVGDEVYVLAGNEYVPANQFVTTFPNETLYQMGYDAFQKNVAVAKQNAEAEDQSETFAIPDRTIIQNINDGGISLSDYRYDCIFNFGGYHFESESYVVPKHSDAYPDEWFALGGLGKCLDPDSDKYTTYEDGKLTEFRWADNHSECQKLSAFETDRYSGCLYKYFFDTSKKSRSEYWVVFYTEGLSEPVYVAFFNANEFTQKEALGIVGAE